MCIQLYTNSSWINKWVSVAWLLLQIGWRSSVFILWTRHFHLTRPPREHSITKRINNLHIHTHTYTHHRIFVCINFSGKDFVFTTTINSANAAQMQYPVVYLLFVFPFMHCWHSIARNSIKIQLPKSTCMAAVELPRCFCLCCWFLPVWIFRSFCFAAFAIFIRPIQLRLFFGLSVNRHADCQPILTAVVGGVAGSVWCCIGLRGSREYGCAGGSRHLVRQVHTKYTIFILELQQEQQLIVVVVWRA